jgi:hypothetical protein
LIWGIQQPKPNGSATSILPIKTEHSGDGYLKLSTREIAVLLNIDPASVRRAKTRLYKKMALPEDE